MKRWIAKPSKTAGKFVVVDTFFRNRDGYTVADGVSRSMALAMVRELERTFS